MAEDALGLIGKTIDGYRVTGLLGEGGMGAVYEAHQERLNRNVAIKVIRPELMGTDRHVKRFLREAKALALLTHPNTTAIYAAGQAEGLLYMALELVRGQTVTATLAVEGPFTVDRAISLTIQMLGAVEAAHALKIIHRDIKPENVMIVLSPGGETAKLLDFGLAKNFDPAESKTFTFPGTTVGTLQYMAPEQVQSASDVDERSDIYSAALVLYEMLTGICPHDAPTAQAIVQKKFNLTPPALRLLRPDAPVSLEQSLAKALSFRPEGRYASAREFADALSAARNDKAPDSDGRVALTGSTRRRFLMSGQAAALAAETVARRAPAGRLAGKQLATYKLEHLIANARSGEVYGAQDLAFERVVALKVVPERGGALERLRKEATLLARIGQPATFAVIDTGVQDGHAYLALLDVQGRTLYDIAREARSFPVERAIACGLSLLGSLAEIHALGVVHRDVHPQNIVVSVGDAGETFRLLDHGLASDPAVAGTPPRPYASPEQEKGAPLDPRSDLFSVGAILKGLALGPDDHVPPALAPVIDRALAELPGDRFQDARTFAEALEAARSAPEAFEGAGAAKDDGSILGRRFGRYRFEQVIGTSSLGTVYRATQLDLRRPVAARVMAPQLAADKDLMKEMVGTAREVAHLRHPAVAQVSEIVISGPRFVAYELVEGKRLPEVVREGALAPGRAARIAIEILGALAEAHDQGLVHGCLEASSIILTPQDYPKIVDFGVAPLRALAKRRPSRAGTSDPGRAYAPPEQVSGEAPSEASDLFAVGCVLFEMLTARPVDLLARSPRRHRPEVPERLDAIVLRSLALRPGERFEDAEALMAALRAVT